MAVVPREEDQVVSALVALCKEMDVKCVVQVGALDGYESDEIRKATEARCITIDADPAAVPCSDKLENYKLLIGDVDSESKTFWSHSTPGLSSKMQRGQNETKIDMRQVSLDTFCTVVGAIPDALIIDTEGTTLEVLKGARYLLRFVRLVYAECQTAVIRDGMSGLLPEVRAYLAERGFTEREGLPAYSAGDQGNYCWVRS